MGPRIGGDLGDAALLGTRAPDAGVRAKRARVTIGWAALNAAAAFANRRRS